MVDETSDVPNAADKAGKPEGRTRSSIEFPYTSLDEAELIAKGVREVGATSCDWDQLAAHLGYAAQGGGFRQRMIGAKMFALVTYERGRIELTDKGLRIVDPKLVRAARVESFLSVPLYKAAFDKLKGQPLPPAAAIERLLESLGVAPKQTDKARQAFMRSAKHAGFLEIAQDRLTIPPNPPTTGSTADTDRDELERRKGNGNGGGTGGGAPPTLHPFILGLLDKLPQPETDWPTSGRVKWLQTAANIFDLIYTDPSGEPEPIQVSMKKEKSS